MNQHVPAARVQLAGMVLIALATAAAFWIGEGASSGLAAGAFMLAVVLAIHVSRKRSATVEALGGIGDERVTSLSTRASAFAATVLATVIPAWWLVTVARGEPNETLSLLGAVFAVAFVGAAAVLQRRG